MLNKVYRELMLLGFISLSLILSKVCQRLSALAVAGCGTEARTGPDQCTLSSGLLQDRVRRGASITSYIRTTIPGLTCASDAARARILQEFGLVSDHDLIISFEFAHLLVFGCACEAQPLPGMPSCLPGACAGAGRARARARARVCVGVALVPRRSGHPRGPRALPYGLRVFPQQRPSHSYAGALIG